jgi:hypothetical protein
MTAKEDKQNDRINKLELDTGGVMKSLDYIEKQLGEIKDIVKSLATKEEIMRLSHRIDELEKWQDQHEVAFRDVAVKLGAISSSVAIVVSIVLSKIT